MEAKSSGSSLDRRSLMAGGAAGLGAWACATAGGEHARGPRTRALVYDEHGGLFVDAIVAGRRARFILDTGASVSALSRAFATQLGLAVEPGPDVEGSAGIVRAGRCSADVEVPDVERLTIAFTVYDFASYDPACVGILGHELLVRAPFAIRYRDRALVWHAGRPTRTIPMELDNRIPRIGALLNGARVDLRIDTGAALAPGDVAYFNVTQGQARELELVGKPEMVFSATGTGDAVLELPVHRLRSASVAGSELPRAFAIVQPPVGYFARPDAVGFVGNAVLDKLDPFLDYERGLFGVAR